MTSIWLPPKPPSASANGSASQPSSAMVDQCSRLKPGFLLRELAPRFQVVVVLDEAGDALLNEFLLFAQFEIHRMTS
jgi:hypothetical protein